MAAKLTPAPVKSEPGSFAWVSWYQQLHNYLNTGASVPWNVIDKTGSNLQDLTIRNHASLTAIGGTGQQHISASEGSLLTNLLSVGHAALSSILGTGSYHVSATEASRITAITTIKSKAGAPTTTDITASNWAIYKDTTAGTLKLWANDGGTLKSVALI